MTTKKGHLIYEDPVLTDTWGHGHVSLGDVTPASCQYVAQYTVDKIYGQKAADHYKDREKERMSCSRNMGLEYLWRNYSAIRARGWTAVMPGGSEFNLPRYFQKKILELGPPELSFVEATNIDYNQEWLDKRSDPENHPAYERASRLAIQESQKALYSRS